MIKNNIDRVPLDDIVNSSSSNPGSRIATECVDSCREPGPLVLESVLDVTNHLVVSIALQLRAIKIKCAASYGIICRVENLTKVCDTARQ